MLLNTFTGRALAPLAPRVADIDIEDIAHALSHQCRYGGHTSAFYSVAQHSVLVSYAVDPTIALWGLLHDGSEAYIIDIPAPLKVTGAMDQYRAVEGLWQQAVYHAFGLTGAEPAGVHDADLALRGLEARALMRPAAATRITSDLPPGLEVPPFRIRPWSSPMAKRRFLDRFAELRPL